MAFATASSPANREPGDNAQTATPPQAQARPRQSPGNAEPPTSATAPSARQSPPAHAGAPSACRSPQRMPEPPTRTRARQRMPEPPACARARQCAPGPSACRNPRRAPEPQRARAPSAPKPASAPESPARAPRRKPGGLAAGHVLVSRAPARAGTKTRLQSVNRAEHRTSGC